MAGPSLTLEQRVTALENRLTAQSEDVQTSYVQIDPATGAIFLVFPGGLIMNEVTPSTPGSALPGGRLQWVDAGGVTRELLEGFSSGAGLVNHVLVIQANADILDTAGLTLGATIGGAAGSATVNADAGSTANPAGATVTIISDAGTSSFLQGLSSATPYTAVAASFVTAREPNATHATMVTVAVYLQANAAPQQTECLVRIGPTAASVTGPLYTGSFLVGFLYLESPGGVIANVIDTAFIVPPGWFYTLQNALDPVAANAVEFITELTL